MKDHQFSSKSHKSLDPLNIQDRVEDVFHEKDGVRQTTATGFFRNEEIFCMLREIVLPNHLSQAKRRSLWIWSAGCSTGEEAYSIALLATDESKTHQKSPMIRIYGTDINGKDLQHAQKGRYLRPAKSAIENKYHKLLDIYAVQDGRHVVMNAEVQKCVRFIQFDLRRRPTKHAFDCIVCNHVLQYYDQSGQIQILHNMLSVLRPEGILYAEGISQAVLEAAKLSRVEGYRNTCRLR